MKYNLFPPIPFSMKRLLYYVYNVKFSFYENESFVS